jgi:hypothetical protein
MSMGSWEFSVPIRAEHIVSVCTLPCGQGVVVCLIIKSSKDVLIQPQGSKRVLCIHRVEISLKLDSHFDLEVFGMSQSRGRKVR